MPSIAIRPSVPHHIRLRWPKPKLGSARTSSASPRWRLRPPCVDGASIASRHGGASPARGARGSRALGQNQAVSAIADRHRAPDHRPGREDRADEQHRRRHRADEGPDASAPGTTRGGRARRRARVVTSTSRLSIGQAARRGRRSPPRLPQRIACRARPESPRSCTPAAATRSPIRACRRPTGRRRPARRGARLRQTLTTNSSTLDRDRHARRRSRAGSARPSPSRPDRCRRAAACRAGRAGASGRRRR